MVSILSVIILLHVCGTFLRMRCLLYSSNQAFRCRMSETRITEPVRLIPPHACLNTMSLYIPFFDDPIPGRRPGDLGGTEKWWAERQEALERAGYMLRSRYQPGWQPSWIGTGKFYSHFEDGQRVVVSLNVP